MRRSRRRRTRRRRRRRRRSSSNSSIHIIISFCCWRTVCHSSWGGRLSLFFGGGRLFLSGHVLHGHDQHSIACAPVDANSRPYSLYYYFFISYLFIQYVVSNSAGSVFLSQYALLLVPICSWGILRGNLCVGLRASLILQ